MDLVGKRVGNYVIERPLKRGGMGSVYTARHPALGRRVAIKFLETPTSELNSRFATEARITASLRHENIVDIFDFGELDGSFYYVMELLSGQDLGEILEKEGRLPTLTALDFLIQVCDGLATAHRAGIVHRDLKPGNIFVEEGPNRQIKLMDFGVAKVLETEASKTNHGVLLGTPAYMAPEQALGDQTRISARTDLYALGVIAYEMLAGRRPFTHDAPMMLVVAHVHETCSPLSVVAPELPQALCRLVGQCLEKDPETRPTSADEIQEALRTCRSELAFSDGSSVSEGSTFVDEQVPPTEWVPHAPTIPKKETRGRPRPTPDAHPTRDTLPKPPPVVPETGGPTRVGPTSKTISQAQNSPHRDDQGARAAAAEETEGPVSLDDSDRSTLKKLLQRMKRRGDLPAFVANVGDVNKKADFEGKYSAHQLSEAILKDHSLTAKLLRVVNSNYVRRFGGKIFSVQQAIVILGFEQVRSLALSVAVFDKSKTGENAGRIADSAVHSLVSGEIARLLAKSCGLEDQEQATVCSMFCHLGRHLALVYLPEQYDRAIERAAKDGIPLERAAERELGISFQKLGLGVAEQWHLPKQIMEAMTNNDRPGTRPHEEVQKLAHLARLSNDLCELVATGLRDADDPKLRQLLRRHSQLLELEAEELPELLSEVQEAFLARYSTLLGKKAVSSRFLQRLPELSPTTTREIESQVDESKPEVAVTRPLAADGRQRHGNRKSVRGRRTVRALDLGQHAPVARDHAANDNDNDNDGPTEGSPSYQQSGEAHPHGDPLSEWIFELTQLLQQPGKKAVVASRSLAFLARELGLKRLLALRPTEAGDELCVIQACGEDAEALHAQLRFPLTPSRQNVDVFSRAFYGKKDVFVRDTFSRKSGAQIPPRYYEAIGSPSLVLLYCHPRSSPDILLLGDTDSESDLPSRGAISRLLEVRRLFARAVA